MRNDRFRIQPSPARGQVRDIPPSDNSIHVLNLNNPDKAVVFNSGGEVLETTMDDIELSIASRYLKQNLKYMED